MLYHSTRGGREKLTAAAAIKTGIAPDGGLFVPEALPQTDNSYLATLTQLDYRQRAVSILEQFLADYSREEITACVDAAYGAAKFDHPAVAPVVTLDDSTHMLELWHGPTSAFKDMALQILPQLLTRALTKTGERAEIVILVATSGDTGKAALEGFRDVDRTRIVVFFPHEGVSEMQRLQMVTQEGGNVAVVAVRGNFDDTQAGVKRIFGDRSANEQFAAHGFKLSSANSINWGRLLPQIVYYFSAYADLLKMGSLSAGQLVNFVVPTGNFGNILAGYYAKLMGLPVNRLVCAANANNVLTDFLRTGVYDRRRCFHKTLSPSMDILVSSNLERLLYHVTGGDSAQVSAWMGQLNTNGVYRVEGEALAAIQETFWSDWADDRDTTAEIKAVYDRYRYLADPHTAVACRVLKSYRQATGDENAAVVVSTASPFKFNDSVLAALSGPEALAGKSAFAAARELSRLTGSPMPPSLAGLENKAVRHTDVCDPAGMKAMVERALLQE
ncbi:threonine synthase [Anaeroselena agilis]|uniref:Threonine synthase n=1 Tax=Anaeroselena agilis TaxID=3063788 RepID=A0ABU3NUI2_9FIRM|nr:threonine synthase [Selenomonadales bacterium 4137-cl]